LISDPHALSGKLTNMSIVIFFVFKILHHTKAIDLWCSGIISTQLHVKECEHLVFETQSKKSESFTGEKSLLTSSTSTVSTDKKKQFNETTVCYFNRRNYGINFYLLFAKPQV
jgi:hypothetical protein